MLTGPPLPSPRWLCRLVTSADNATRLCFLEFLAVTFCHGDTRRAGARPGARVASTRRRKPAKLSAPLPSQ